MNKTKFRYYFLLLLGLSIDLVRVGYGTDTCFSGGDKEGLTW